jgi:septal ring factor EnvC (AmiA/AmiB activator)
MLHIVVPKRCADSIYRPEMSMNPLRNAILALICLATLPISAAERKAKIDNTDVEVARVREQIEQIQKSTLSREAKARRQRTLISAEMDRVRAQIAELEAAEKKASGESKENSAARDHRKHAVDNMKKFLAILSAMNPQL